MTGSRVTVFFCLKNEFFLLDKVVKLVGGGSVIKGAYAVFFSFLQFQFGKKVIYVQKRNLLKNSLADYIKLKMW